MIKTVISYAKIIANRLVSGQYTFAMIYFTLILVALLFGEMLLLGLGTLGTDNGVPTVNFLIR